MFDSIQPVEDKILNEWSDAWIRSHDGLAFVVESTKGAEVIRLYTSNLIERETFWIENKGILEGFRFTYRIFSRQNSLRVTAYREQDVDTMNELRLAKLEADNKRLQERLAELEELIDRPNGVGSRLGFEAVQRSLEE